MPALVVNEIFASGSLRFDPAFMSRLGVDQLDRLGPGRFVGNTDFSLADAVLVSFESADHPGHFLRHQSFRLKLHKDSGDELFKKDATFRVVPGLADAALVSFESFNYPGYFIRHRDLHLYVEKGSDDLFRKDATFSFIDAQAR